MPDQRRLHRTRMIKECSSDNCAEKAFANFHSHGNNRLFCKPHLAAIYLLLGRSPL